MGWRLREGISLHPMPFGGGFVLDGTRLAARQISAELTQLLADTPPPESPPAPAEPPPALVAELRLGIEDGWLIHQEETT